ncbi:L-threonylcarbamoyladenylate synthase [Caminicella sporogenes]|nr:L-threonylcarbamoyladenylate synthase [Caminicella sporogenes]WIF96165.1 L-threonylcarbamoyladenylate synthase [Caminicella sporogenes]
MNTKFINIDPDNIDMEKLKIVADILKNGGTVAFPTETVYGLGANALCEEAVKKIFKAKGRPSDNPLIVHVSKLEDINELVLEISEKAQIVMEKFWPGPITLIFKKSDIVPKIVTGGLDTVAIRLPSHPIARKLIKLSGVPVAAPSANLSGKPSPTKEKHVTHDLMGRVDAIVCGGDTEVGVESTVLDLTSNVPMILRPGGITKEDLQEVIGKVETDPAILSKRESNLVPKSPGMKYTHYSPNAEVILVDGRIEEVVKVINKVKKEKECEGYKVGVMATEETKDKYFGENIISLGSRKDLKTVAANLFKVLREFDEKRVDIVLAETFEEVGIGQAIMNRLMKAAGYNVIHAGENKN